MITGNIDGIKKIILDRLENLFNLSIDTSSIFSYKLAVELNNISKTINKELCVVISRYGKITAISVGRVSTAEIPYMKAGSRRLNGFRVIHTHHSGNSKLSTVDLSSLMEFKLDAMVSIGINEDINKVRINIGFCDSSNNSLTCEELPNLSLEAALAYNFRDKLNHIEQSVLCSIDEFNDDTDRAILVGTDTEESLQELCGLSEACSIIPTGKILQRKNKIHSTYYTGQGKVQEILQLKQLKKANLVIFDDELSGSQVRNLEKALSCSVLDRTTLILDIFARRAKSKVGKLQVELAMLNHKLPRLRNANANLSRIKGGVGVKGGIGSRGPGEKKLETDKRHIERRIEEIKAELVRAASQRDIQKVKRNKNNMSNVAIVGYTNAGKSTLRNKLSEFNSNSDKKAVLEANMLFATLDTTVRAIKLNDNRDITLSDTVGFISKLPHELVEAFKSTLEEVTDANLLLHVVDASNKDAVKQISTVNLVLNELNAGNKNTIIVLNKIDRASEDNLQEIRNFLWDEKIIEISAVKKINLEKLLDMISSEIPAKLVEKDFIIPYSEQRIVSFLHKNSQIIDEEYIENGTRIKALVQDEIYRQCVGFEARI